MMTLKHNLHRGFSLITAIFLLVVLGTLGTLMVTFFVAQQQSSALDVTGSRAYQASRAGIEWAAYYVATTPTGAQWALCDTGQTLNGMAETLAPFTVTVTCKATSAVEGASTINVYNITSTATFGGVPGNADYVERSINVTMGR